MLLRFATAVRLQIKPHTIANLRDTLVWCALGWAVFTVIAVHLEDIPEAPYLKVQTLNGLNTEVKRSAASIGFAAITEASDALMYVCIESGQFDHAFNPWRASLTEHKMADNCNHLLVPEQQYAAKGRVKADC